jgi:hypothetical protein
LRGRHGVGFPEPRDLPEHSLLLERLRVYRRKLIVPTANVLKGNWLISSTCAK